MATHFARGILTEGHLISVRLPSQCHQEARNLPPHRQSRFEVVNKNWPPS